MPPPTSSDAWLASRRFGIVVDAGSSGSRLQIYSWKDAGVERGELGQGGRALDVLPRVEKGTQRGEDWVTKVEPGISSFALEPSLVGPYLAPLLEHAQNQIPPSLHASTPIYLLATAGMRLLDDSHRNQIIDSACTFLRFHSNFLVHPPSAEGPCGSSVLVISGEDEGLFGWVAVNYLMDGFSSRDGQRATYGFLDMGGASTQIAFEPNEQERLHPTVPLRDVKLRLLSGQDIHHQVFVTTWLGYGTNQARERYVGNVVAEWDTHPDRTPSVDASSSIQEDVPDPCLPRSLSLVEAPYFSDYASDHSRTPHNLVGTGSFPECLKRTSPLLNKDAPCPDTPCLFNGVHVPPIDFSVSRFIGVSEYWYSSEHVFGLGGAYDFVQYERAATEFCSKDWSIITEEHFASKAAGTLGGDIPPEQSGRVTIPGKWDSDVERARLELQCFKAAWLVNVLHEGIGLPRIVDPGGNSTSSASDRFEDSAGKKGLGAAAFQSMDVVGETAITWSLGKMVLEASGEIPLRDALPPIPPAAAADDTEADSGSSHAPLFNFDDFLDDRIKDKLHPSLTHNIFGISVVSLLFYLILASSILILAYRLRARLRLFRKPNRQRRDTTDFSLYVMESGSSSNGGGKVNDLISPPISPTGTRSKTLPSFMRHIMRRLRTTLLPRSSHAHTPGTYTPVRPNQSQSQSSSSLSLGAQSRLNPYGMQQNGSFIMRGPSPVPSSGDNSSPPSPTRSSALSPNLPSLSRNSSQVNLPTLVSRSGSYMRGGGPR